MGRRRQRPLLLKRYARNECRGRPCHSRPRLLSSYFYGTLSRRGAAPRGGGLGEPVEHLVKVAEIYRYEDVNDLATHVYNGNILVLDYTSVSSDELALKRITAELKSAVRDCGGDVAVVGKNMLMATPAGIKIDRAKIKGNF